MPAVMAAVTVVASRMTAMREESTRKVVCQRWVYLVKENFREAIESLCRHSTHHLIDGGEGGTDKSRLAEKTQKTRVLTPSKPHFVPAFHYSLASNMALWSVSHSVSTKTTASIVSQQFTVLNLRC